MKVLTEQDVIAVLRKRVDASSQVKVAAEMGIHPSMMNDLIHGRRAVSDRIAKKLGYTKKVVYQK